MQTEIITIYCLCVEYLAASGHRDDYQATATTAEVMTVALVAARFFKGCLESSRQFLIEHSYMRQMLSWTLSIGETSESKVSWLKRIPPRIFDRGSPCKLSIPMF